MTTLNKILIYIYSQDAYNLSGTVTSVVTFIRHFCF